MPIIPCCLIFKYICKIKKIRKLNNTTMATWGGPITQSGLNDSQQNFYWLYDVINGDISNLPLRCLTADFQTALGINATWANNTTEGVILQYIVEKTDSDQPLFSFALVNAVINPQGQAVPQTGAIFFSLLASGGIYLYDTPQRQLELAQWTADYGQVRLRRMEDLNTLVFDVVDNLPLHPRSAFFTCDAIWKFMQDNVPAPGNSEIIIKNTALYCPITASAPENEYKCASPALYFDNGSVMLSDSFLNPPNYFEYKGLNCARHCPPFCV